MGVLLLGGLRGLMGVLFLFFLILVFNQLALKWYAKPGLYIPSGIHFQLLLLVGVCLSSSAISSWTSSFSVHGAKPFALHPHWRFSLYETAKMIAAMRWRGEGRRYRGVVACHLHRWIRNHP